LLLTSSFCFAAVRLLLLAAYAASKLPKEKSFLEVGHHHHREAPCTSMDGLAEKGREQSHGHGIQCKGRKCSLGGKNLDFVLAKASCQIILLSQSFLHPAKHQLSGRSSESTTFLHLQLLSNAGVTHQQLTEQR